MVNEMSKKLEVTQSISSPYSGYLNANVSVLAALSGRVGESKKPRSGS